MWQTKPEREQKQEREQSRWGFRGMTVRDWLPIVGALLIPVVIAAGTWGITWQQGSLEGATMPNGQKYEDWLKSKDRKEYG